MSRERPPKKSETLEVRLPHEVKNALMRKAQGEGRSASDVIRQSIDTYLAGKPKEERSMITPLWKSAGASGVAGAAIWMAIASVPVQAKIDFKPAFEAFDQNRDGFISMDEFVGYKSEPLVVERLQAKTSRQGDQQSTMMTDSEIKDGATPGVRSTTEALRSHFRKMDANSDGRLTFEEFRAFHEQ